MIPPVRLLSFLPALCLAACAGSGSNGPATKMATENQSPDPIAQTRIKSGDMFDDDRDKIADKFGSYNTSTDKEGRPSAAGKEFTGFKRENAEFKGRWDNKEFQPGKKSFWGDKDYAKKVYAGDTDGSAFKKESRFGDKAASEVAMNAREGSQTYVTKDYQTGRAREAAGRRIATTSDAETDSRRRAFTDPAIIPWQQQNLTVEDTREMLGHGKKVKKSP